jgi:predicted metalloendopeptidase
MLPYQQTFSETPVRIVNPAFFQTLDQLFNTTKEDVIVMYIYTKAIVTGLLPYAPLAIRKSMDGIYTNDTSKPFSTGHCLDSTLSMLRDEFHVEYRIRYKDQIDVQTSYYSNLSTTMKETLRNYLSSSSELSSLTTNTILDKLQQLDIRFPSAPQIPWSVSFPNTLDVSYLYRASSTSQVNMIKKLDKIGNPVTESEFAWNETLIGFDSGTNVLGMYM